MVDKLTVTTVGLFAAKEFLLIAKNNGINPVNAINMVNKGMLGNFITLTYEVNIPDGQMVMIRKKLMQEITDTKLLVALYEHGDWSRVYILAKSAFR